MICTPHHTFFGSYNQGRVEGWGISTDGGVEKCVQDFGAGDYAVVITNIESCLKKGLYYDATNEWCVLQSSVEIGTCLMFKTCR